MAFNKGCIPWNKGKDSRIKKKCMNCGKEIISYTKKYCSRPCWFKAKIGMTSPAKGYKWTEEQKQKIKGKKGMKGKDNPNWKGGIKKSYTSMFRKKLNTIIKERDNFTCQYCGNNSKKMLVAHHIDENTLNDCPSNLTTLCKICHGRLHHG